VALQRESAGQAPDLPAGRQAVVLRTFRRAACGYPAGRTAGSITGNEGEKKDHFFSTERTGYTRYIIPSASSR